MGSPPQLLRTALWLDAWVRGGVAGDDLLDALADIAPDAAPVVELPGAPRQPLVALLAETQRAGVDGVWLLLPRPGRTAGWPAGVAGPPEPAVLLSAGSDALLLRIAPAGWHVDRLPGCRVDLLMGRALPARAAGRVFAELLAEAAERLERLGLERPSQRAVPMAWAGALDRIPRGIDPGAAGLLARIGAVLDAVDLALREDGAAVTAAESRARRDELRSLTGRLEDLVADVVGGLNLPVPANPPARPPRTAANGLPDKLVPRRP